MHIAYLTSEFMTEKWHGGLAAYLDNITSIMSENGHDVTIITLSEKKDRIHYRDKVEVVRVQANTVRSVKDNVGHGIDLLRNSWKIYQTLLQENRRKQIDIVQAANFQAVGFFRNYHIPTVIRASSEASLWRNAAKFDFDYDNALKEWTLEDFLEIWCVKKADACFAPSHFCASAIKVKSKREIDVIESPYLLRNNVEDESVYKNKLEHKKYLLFNSSLSCLKGTHVGIEATEYIMEKYSDLYMVYAGYDYGLSQKDGSVQKIVNILKRQNKKYEGRVIYLGHLTQDKLFPVIRNSLACVLPSRVDNLPNSCIEAMALGSIVIGTYGASFEQLIENKKNGLLIKRDSSTAFIKAVNYLVEMRDEERKDMGKKAMHTIERLQPQKVYSEMIKFYEKIIAKHRKKISSFYHKPLM